VKNFSQLLAETVFFTKGSPQNISEMRHYQFWFEAVAALFKRDQQAAAAKPAEAPKEPKLCLIRNPSTSLWQTAEISPIGHEILEYQDPDGLLHLRLVGDPEVELLLYSARPGMKESDSFLDVLVDSGTPAGGYRGWYYLHEPDLWKLPIPQVKAWKDMEEFRRAKDALEMEKELLTAKTLQGLEGDLNLELRSVEGKRSRALPGLPVLYLHAEYQKLEEIRGSLQAMAEEKFREENPELVEQLLNLIRRIGQLQMHASQHFRLQFELVKLE